MGLLRPKSAQPSPLPLGARPLRVSATVLQRTPRTIGSMLERGIDGAGWFARSELEWLRASPPALHLIGHASGLDASQKALTLAPSKPSIAPVFVRSIFIVGTYLVCSRQWRESLKE